MTLKDTLKALFHSGVNPVGKRESHTSPLAMGQPISALTLGHGSSFLYRQGVLCYVCVTGKHVRILNLRDANSTEAVIDVKKLFAAIDAPAILHFIDQPFAVEVLHYEGAKVCLLFSSDEVRFLVIVDIRRDVLASTDGKNRLKYNLWAVGPGSIANNLTRPSIRVRFTDQHLFYFSNCRSNFIDGRQWELNVRAFDEDFGESPNEYNTQGLQDLLDGKIERVYEKDTIKLPCMQNLFRTWAGDAFTIDIFDDHLFIASNHSNILPYVIDSDAKIARNDEVEESFYQFHRFPLTGECESKEIRVPFRLQTARIARAPPSPESILGVSRLFLHKEEPTGQISLVEQRHDLLTGKRFVIQPLDFMSDNHVSGAICSIDQSSLWCNIPQLEYEERPIGKPDLHYVTPNVPTIPPAMPDDVQYDAYVPACDSVLSLQLSSVTIAEGEKSSGRVHIIINRRSNGADVKTMTSSTVNNGNMAHQRIWPATTTPEPLQSVLDPFPQVQCDIRASSDDKHLVYMIGPKDETTHWTPADNVGIELYDTVDHSTLQEVRSKADGGSSSKDKGVRNEPSLNQISGNNAIVLVNYDPAVRFQGLASMDLAPVEQRGGVDIMVTKLAETALDDRDSSDTEEASGSDDWFTIKPAMWTSIKKGFEFHYAD